MSLSIAPFTVQLPSGYSLSAAGSGAQAADRVGFLLVGATSTRWDHNRQGLRPC